MDKCYVFILIKTMRYLSNFFFSFIFCSLECLYLGGNFIKEIPPELGNLPSLNYLVLCDNKIQSVPPQLSQWVFSGVMCTHTSVLRNYCPAFTHMVCMWKRIKCYQSKWYRKLWGMLWIGLLIFNFTFECSDIFLKITQPLFSF